MGAAFGGYARKLLRDELLAVNVRLNFLALHRPQLSQALGPPLKLEEHEEFAASASSKVSKD